VTSLEFGLTLTVVGMGGTLIILFLITLVMDALIKLFPPDAIGKEGLKK
jgi:Na+-transporting methylmalonyl-CoA/oxaloacetate decarboxylase gamma subunit